MEAPLWLAGEQGIEGHHVLDLDRMHVQTGCDGLDCVRVDATEAVLHSKGTVKQSAPTTRKLCTTVSTVLATLALIDVDAGRFIGRTKNEAPRLRPVNEGQPIL